MSAGPGLFDLDAERALIGAALVAPAVLEDPQLAGLAPGAFHDARHRAAWRTLLDMAGERTAIDPLTVGDRLPADAGLTPADLTGLINACPSSQHAAAYAGILAQLADRRRLLEAASGIARLAHELNGRGDPFASAAELLAAAQDGRPLPDLDLWSAAVLCELSFDGVPWLLPGHLPEAGLVLLAGDVASGKSWLALDLGLAAASGGSIMGQTFTRPTPTLYLGPDSSTRTLATRVRELCAGREIPGPATFQITGEAINLTQAAGVERLRRMIRQTGARLVVLDVLARFMVGVDENAAGEIAPVLTSLRGLANTEGATVLLLHHLNKGGLAGAVRSWLQAIRGSVELAGCVDVAYTLTSKGDFEQAERVLRQQKNRDAREARPLRFSIQPGEAGGVVLAWDAAPAGDRAESNLVEATAELMDQALREAAGVGATMTRVELESFLLARDALPRRSTVTEALRVLRSRPGVSTSRRGKETVFHANSDRPR